MDSIVLNILDIDNVVITNHHVHDRYVHIKAPGHRSVFFFLIAFAPALNYCQALMSRRPELHMQLTGLSKSVLVVRIRQRGLYTTHLRILVG